MDNSTQIQAEAIAQVRKSFTDRIFRLRAELATQPHGEYIFAWEQYSLGVTLMADGSPRTVCVSDAKVYHSRPGNVTFRTVRARRPRSCPAQ